MVHINITRINQVLFLYHSWAVVWSPVGSGKRHICCFPG